MPIMSKLFVFVLYRILYLREIIMASFETMKNRVLVSDMTGTLFDPKNRCARCNLPIKSEPIKIGNFLYGRECGLTAGETMAIEKDADKTRVITRYEDLRYRALTTVIGQYGRLTPDGHEPFCGVDSVERTFAKWEISIDDMIDYCNLRWARQSQRAHRNMVIEHLTDLKCWN